MNGESVELVYCPIHGEWYQCDDEMNCCAREIEHFLQNRRVNHEN
jgi:hypothetical protein